MADDGRGAPAGVIREGDVVEVDCGAVAHGGAVIAHYAGRTLLVRHALPGERVSARVTQVRTKIVRADAVEVLSASPDRVVPPCRHARPGGCGGCDLQHARLSTQREWKAQVVGEALARAGVWDGAVRVEALPGDVDGLHWRTRVRWTVGPEGRPGLLRHRSHDVVDVGECLLATDGIASWLATRPRFPRAAEVTTSEGGDRAVTVAVDGAIVSGPPRIRQTVGGRTWRLSPETFWQVHPAAASTLAACVMELGQPHSGEAWWDLYAGAGLFSAALAQAVGAQGAVDAVESSAAAVRDARRALHDLPQVRLHEAPVDGWRPTRTELTPHGVVLDPPRSGAGPGVMEMIAAAAPRIVVYVSCDPMTLARDLRVGMASGYRVAQVRAFDTFPMTHHVETVAALVPIGAGHQIS